jgi:precorrin-6A/cobalt-precorrin-6A reductase
MRCLILGGTSEASDLARRLADDRRFSPTLSLAGVTRSPVLPNIPVRLGGFGGVDGLAEWLRRYGVEVMVIATHPFAARMRDNALQASARIGLPAVWVIRPEWRRTEGDDWREVDSLDSAAELLGSGAFGEQPRVLLTIGRKEVAAFRGLACPFVIRSIDPPPPEVLPTDARIIAARGPFTLEDEMALLGEIDVLVTKNSGASAVEAKLEAARCLRRPVIMVRRPPLPPGLADHAARAATAGEALAWLAAQAHRRLAERGV